MSSPMPDAPCPMPPPSGFLLIDKPAGMTSHDVVDAVRRILGCMGRKGRSVCKVGHAGTLDPFATGLLIIGIGDATKRLQEIVGLDKTYDAVARLGARSTTDDLEGEMSDWRSAIGSGPVSNHQFPITNPPDIHQIENALNAFRGGYTQQAPAFSAKKIGGKKLYELARKGKIDTVERPVKDVKIHELVVTKYAWPDLAFRVSCSSGTYVRALARDIGEKLGCGAYLTELRRTSIGTFRVEDAVGLNEGMGHRASGIGHRRDLEKHLFALQSLAEATQKTEAS
jgi:tRNA pseudouridine55 synthase